MATESTERWRPARQSRVFLDGLRAILRTLAKQRVTGLEHIPKTGPALLVFNQLSVFDTPLLRLSVPRMDMCGLVARDYAANPVYRFLVQRGGGIWITRDSGDRGALGHALSALEQGWLVGISPEGRRSRSGGLERGKPGIAFLVHHARVPILPVALIGTDRIAASLRRLHRATVEVRIGPPFTVPAALGEGRDARRLTVDYVMGRLATQLPARYRGFYADPPSPESIPTAQMEMTS